MVKIGNNFEKIQQFFGESQLSRLLNFKEEKTVCTWTKS